MIRGMKLPRPLIAVLLAAFALVAVTGVAEAKHEKLFRPDQPPLSQTGAVRAAKAQIKRLDHVRHPGSNYIHTASQRNARIVGQLNARRSKRNKERANYLQDKLSAYADELIDPVNERYDRGIDAAKREYRRDVHRINNGNDKGRKKRAALRRAREDYTSKLDRLAAVRSTQLNRANDNIARTRQANFAFYKRISDREKREIKALKVGLRRALAELRNRGGH